ncbi:MAG: hypothetical protein GXO44_01380 [Deferribacteres bacterium]|nr:hypothetical protein [Deferribacteres bacterium]
MGITKDDIINVAINILDNRSNPSRDDMKRAAGRTLSKLVLDEGAAVEEILAALDVDFDYEEPLESKIDKALWQIFAEIVVFIDRERRGW